MMNEKKVLVAAPVSSRHDYVIREYVNALAKQDYPFDLMLVDNTTEGDYMGTLKKVTKPLSDLGKKVFIEHITWDTVKDHVLQMLAKAREVYRVFAVKNGCDYIFHLDIDMILHKGAIRELVDCDRDSVGFVVHVFYPPDTRPCVFKHGELRRVEEGWSLGYYSWRTIYRWKSQGKKLVKVYATGLGCLLSKRKVFEKVPFRAHPSFVWGEDLFFINEATEKGFEFYVNTKRVKHKNINWNEPTSKSKKQMKFFLAIGLEEAWKKMVEEGELKICKPRVQENLMK